MWARAIGTVKLLLAIKISVTCFAASSTDSKMRTRAFSMAKFLAVAATHWARNEWLHRNVHK
jgi:hypothetical protein